MNTAFQAIDPEGPDLLTGSKVPNPRGWNLGTIVYRPGRDSHSIPAGTRVGSDRRFHSTTRDDRPMRARKAVTDG